MKKVFEDDKSYIEIVSSKNPGHVILTLVARDSDKNFNVTMVSVEIHKDELKQIIEAAEKEGLDA